MKFYLLFILTALSITSCKKVETTPPYLSTFGNIIYPSKNIIAIDSRASSGERDQLLSLTDLSEADSNQRIYVTYQISNGEVNPPLITLSSLSVIIVHKTVTSIPDTINADTNVKIAAYYLFDDYFNFSTQEGYDEYSMFNTKIDKYSQDSSEVWITLFGAIKSPSYVTTSYITSLDISPLQVTNRDNILVHISNIDNVEANTFIYAY